ncbi:MAG TPA: DUF3307 domain-containing protein [Firmicutes bacterium]|nr:DUF3307 domain-containing protein [Bacillota bacterium]
MDTSLDTVFLVLLAHALSDFLLQPGSIALAKCQGRFSGYLAHFTILLAVSISLTLGRSSLRMVLAILSVALLHVLTDWGKNLIARGRSAQVELGLFVLDQALHISAVILVVSFFFPPSVLSRDWTGGFLPGLLSGLVEWLTLVPATTSQKALTVYSLRWVQVSRLLVPSAFIYLYAIFGGAVLVRKVLDLDWVALPGTNQNSLRERSLKVGRYIGMLERAILTAFVACGAYHAVGFVIAAKSVARFKDLEDRGFAEYYLVGTLTSSCIAVVAGFLLRTIWNFGVV